MWHRCFCSSELLCALPHPHLTEESDQGNECWYCTNSSVTLLKDLVGQQFQRAAVHSRSRRQVPLDCMVRLPTVGGAWVEYYLPLYGSGFWVPKTWADKELNSINLRIHSSRQSLKNSMNRCITTSGMALTGGQNPKCKWMFWRPQGSENEFKLVP